MLDLWPEWASALGSAVALMTLLAAAGVSHGAANEAVAVTIFRDPSVEPIRFAAGEVRRALAENGFVAVERTLDEVRDDRSTVRIVLTTRDAKVKGAPPADGLEEQGYALRRVPGGDGVAYWAIGADPVGAMYAGLEVAEQVRLSRTLDGIAERTAKPFILRRGLKCNIPLDARTPSYDDTGDSAQENYVHMWDFSFWQEFLDHMARYRYNTLTLWNPHPFPSLVRLPEYPDVALDDVCVTTLKPSHEARSWHEPMFVHPPVFQNLKVVRKMSIDEKIAFWRSVMQHAKDRGIDIYFITWNVLTNGTQGKHGITDAQDNPKTIAYLRACVRECVLTYPLLAGIGVTAGENMRDRKDEFAKEKWLWQTYGLGVLDAKKQQPGRTVRFLHRVWQTGVGEVMTEFGSKYPDTFELGFKYARAHMYSTPNPPFAEKLCEELKRHGVKCWWNLRNDDIFNFRWGDPDYARDFLRRLPPRELTAGYHMGSDGYVWGREFTSLQPETPRALEIEKHWYSFMLWGRLGYDPSLDRVFFEKVLAARFPQAPAARLYEAWQAASKVIPLVNRFHWRDWDFQWAVEGCVDQRQGFHSVEDFIRTRPMERSGILAIPEYVALQLASKPIEGTTPLDVAMELRGHAESALSHVAAVRGQLTADGAAADAPSLRELRQTLGDIEAMAHMGLYYSAKILGAVELCTFRRSKDQSHKEAAIRHLEEAVGHWRRYAEAASKLYRPQLLARTRQLDWLKALDDVRRDVEIARTSAAD